MILSLLRKYILPKEVDFFEGLQAQAKVIKKIVDDLHNCFSAAEEGSCQAIVDDEHRAKEIKAANMNSLLDSFITPVDRESIYRVITQLDWIAVSVRHFVLEARAYEVTLLEAEYAELFSQLRSCADALLEGFEKLGTAKTKEVAADAQRVRDGYEQVVELYVQKMARLSKSNNLNEMFVHKELLGQLKEVGKRFQVCANSLEDIVIKTA